MTMKSYRKLAQRTAILVLASPAFATTANTSSTLSNQTVKVKSICDIPSNLRPVQTKEKNRFIQRKLTSGFCGSVKEKINYFEAPREQSVSLTTGPPKTTFDFEGGQPVLPESNPKLKLQRPVSYNLEKKVAHFDSQASLASSGYGSVDGSVTSLSSANGLSNSVSTTLSSIDGEREKSVSMNDLPSQLKSAASRLSLDSAGHFTDEHQRLIDLGGLKNTARDSQNSDTLSQNKSITTDSLEFHKSSTPRDSLESNADRTTPRDSLESNADRTTTKDSLESNADRTTTKDSLESNGSNTGLTSMACNNLANLLNDLANRPGDFTNLLSDLANRPDILANHKLANLLNHLAKRPGDLTRLLNDLANNPNVLANMPNDLNNLLNDLANNPNVLANIPNDLANLLLNLANRPNVLANLLNGLTNVPNDLINISKNDSTISRDFSEPNQRHSPRLFNCDESENVATQLLDNTAATDPQQKPDGVVTTQVVGDRALRKSSNRVSLEKSGSRKSSAKQKKTSMRSESVLSQQSFKWDDGYDFMAPFSDSTILNERRSNVSDRISPNTRRSDRLKASIPYASKRKDITPIAALAPPKGSYKKPITTTKVREFQFKNKEKYQAPAPPPEKQRQKRGPTPVTLNIQLQQFTKNTINISPSAFAANCIKFLKTISDEVERQNTKPCSFFELVSGPLVSYLGSSQTLDKCFYDSFRPMLTMKNAQHKWKAGVTNVALWRAALSAIPQPTALCALAKNSDIGFLKTQVLDAIHAIPKNAYSTKSSRAKEKKIKGCMSNIAKEVSKCECDSCSLCVCRCKLCETCSECLMNYDEPHIGGDELQISNGDESFSAVESDSFAETDNNDMAI